MTYIDKGNYTLEFEQMYQAWTGEDEVDLGKAKNLGLIDVPVVITTDDIEEWNEIYWNTVLRIIAEYLVTDEDYEEIIKEWETIVDYCLG